jgi:hypothetical protein
MCWVVFDRAFHRGQRVWYKFSPQDTAVLRTLHHSACRYGPILQLVTDRRGGWLVELPLQNGTTLLRSDPVPQS